MQKGDPQSEARRKGERALSDSSSHPTNSDRESFPRTGEGDLYGFRDPAKIPSTRPGNRQVADPRAERETPTCVGGTGTRTKPKQVLSRAKTQKRLANDPTAGSPTVTLLRLLLPLNAQVWESSRATLEA